MDAVTPATPPPWVSSAIHSGQTQAQNDPRVQGTWGILAKHVRENGPETLSYELCASDQNDDEFMIVEVCPSRKPRPASPLLRVPTLHPSPPHTEIPLVGVAAPDQRALQGVQGVVDQLRRGLEKSGMSCVETGRSGYAAK